MHPVHFHIGMYVAIAALLITAMKSSESVIAVLYPISSSQSSHNLLMDTYLREAETHQRHYNLASARFVSNSGL